MLKAYRLTLDNGKVSYMLAAEPPVIVIMLNGEHSLSGAGRDNIQECGIAELEAAWAREDKFRKAVLNSAKYAAAIGKDS